MTAELVDHPAHYGGKDDPFEHVKVAEALGWVSNAFIYNCTKYIWRCGRKEGAPTLRDLQKARWYLDREIQRLEDLERTEDQDLPPYKTDATEGGRPFRIGELTKWNGKWYRWVVYSGGRKAGWVAEHHPPATYDRLVPRSVAEEEAEA